MNLYSVFDNLTAGSVVSILVIILSLIEITPIKISPLKWIGNRINEEMRGDVKELNERVDSLDLDLAEHKAEGYRTNILGFADDVMHGKVFPHQKWRDMLRMCKSYEDLIEKKNLINGDATEAIEYLREEYKECVRNGYFTDFPKKDKK